MTDNLSQSLVLLAEAVASSLPGSPSSAVAKKLRTHIEDVTRRMFLAQQAATPTARLLAMSGRWVKTMEGHAADKKELDKIKAEVGRLTAGPLARAAKPFEKQYGAAVAAGYMIAARQVERDLTASFREADAPMLGTLTGLFADQSIPPEVLAWANDYSSTMVTGLNATTQRRMGNVIAAAMQQQRRGVEDVARGLDFFWPEMGRDRTRLIAHTEMAESMGAGAYERNVSLGSQDKEWITVGDDRVSLEVCAPNEMQGKIKVGRGFQSGHLYPPGHPACRCGAGYTGATRATVDQGMSPPGIADWMSNVGFSMAVHQAMRTSAEVTI